MGENPSPLGEATQGQEPSEADEDFKVEE